MGLPVIRHAGALMALTLVAAPAAAQSVRMRWYQSEIDGQDQPYAVIPPRGADPSKALGLIIGLHGHYGGPGAYCALLLGGAKPPPDFVVACPYGYGDTAFRFIGEHDLIEVIGRVADEHPIDANRVFVTGASDGGIAAYEVALHHPDLFAASMVLAAHGGMTAFPSIGRVGHTAAEAALIRLRSATSWALNAAAIPFFIANGANDTWKPLPEETVAHHLRAFGSPVEEVIHPDLAHDTWTRTYKDGFAFEWFRGHRRDPDPARVVFTTADPRYRSAGWVTDLVLEAPIERFGRVEATASKGLVEVRTSGLIGITVDPPPSTGPSPAAVLLDGERFPPRAGARAFHRAGEHWRAGPEPTGRYPGLRKASGLAGPLDDFRSKPVVFVHGSTRFGERLKALAKGEQAFWTRGIRVDYPVIPDHEVTDEDRASRTLVLLGGPTMNRISCDLGDHVPVRTREDSKAILVGDRAHVGPGLGYRVIYPSPWAPGQYVVVVGGTDIEGVEIASLLPELQPDYVVAGMLSKARTRGMVLGPGRSVLEADFFDRVWRLKPRPPLGATP
jgi:hypothetical protein